MDTQNEKTFRTKTGYCHILPDKIVFSKDGRLESVSYNKPKNHNPILFKVIYGIITFGVFYFVIYKYNNGEMNITETALTIGITSIFLFLISNSLKQQTITYIDRQQILKVKYIPSLGPLTYGRFDLSFKTDSGQTLTTRITLRDHNVFGKKETDDAVKIMTEENLIPDIKDKNVG